MGKQSRIPLIARENATDEQRRVGDFIYVKRDEEYAGPSALMLRIPRLAECFEFMREHVQAAGLPDDLHQLATLVLARHWSVDYIWNVRANIARRVGIAEDIIQAIANRKKPNFADPRMDAIYDYVSELLGPVGVSDATYAKAKQALGSDEQLIELTAVVGLYTFLAFQGRLADLPMQPDGQALSK
jgi:4-carboxymuconolactone decarboxylase